jgi:hypothetical protein
MIYDISYAADDLSDFVDFCDNAGFKRAVSVGRRTGGSAERNKLSEYEYIRTSRILKEIDLYKKIKDISTKLGIWEYVLVHYILQLQPNDFLDLQDCWHEKSGYRTIGKFFSIALTNGNYITISDKLYKVPQYHAIEFSPTTLHEIKTVSTKQTWLVYMIPDHLNVLDSNIKIITD